MKSYKNVKSREKRGRIFAYKTLIFAGLIFCTLFSYSKAVAYSSIPPVGQTVVDNHTVGQVSARPFSNGNAGGMFYTSGETFQAISVPLSKRGDPSAYYYALKISYGALSSSTPIGSPFATSSLVKGSSIYDNRYATSSTAQQYTVFPFSSPVTLLAGYYYLEFFRPDYFGDGTNYITTRKLVATSTYDQQDAWTSRVSSSGMLNSQWFSKDLLWFTGSTSIPAYTETDNPLYANQTRLIDFTPANGAVLASSSPVTFTMHAYVAPEDVGSFIGVRFTLHNIDQNVLLLNRLSPLDFYLLDGFQATTSGDFYYTSGEYYLGTGNYRLEAQLERSYFGGWVVNPYSPINDTQSHQFIVGEGTYLGNLAQSAFSELQEFLGNEVATSTSVTAAACNPALPNTFDVRLCMMYLFIPDGAALQNSVLGLKDMVLSRVPWGYATRFYNIISSTGTTSLPAFSINLHLGAGSETAPATSTLTFDPDDMLSGGAALAGSIRDPTYGKSVRDIFEPLVKMAVAISVLFIIVEDLLKIGGHESSGTGGGGGRSPTQRQAALTRKEYNF